MIKITVHPSTAAIFFHDHVTFHENHENDHDDGYYSKGICWLHRLCTSTRDRGQDYGQQSSCKIQCWSMPMVHTCAQLYTAICLWAGPVGVARFVEISRGGACGRGQVLIKSQGLGQGQG